MTSAEHPVTRPAFQSQLSSAIAVSRIICILGVIYVHAWTGLDGGRLTASAGSFQGLFRWTLMELLGRSAVPLLSIISGWLVLGAAAAKPYGMFLAGKARVILLPMLYWNMIAMLIISGGAYLGLVLAPIPQSSWNAVDQLFSLLSPNETNVQMAFLRDLFVCMALAPLLVRLPSAWLICICGLTAAWSISTFQFPLMLRPAILCFFVFGMLARRYSFEVKSLTVPIPAVLFAFVALAAARIYLEVIAVPAGFRHHQMAASADLSLRFAAALLFWRVAWQLAGSRWSNHLLRLEPYVFFIFCAHLVLIWIGGPIIGEVTGPLGSPFYPLFLLLQPFLIAIVCIGLARLLMMAAPKAARTLSGGRLRSPITAATSDPRRSSNRRRHGTAPIPPAPPAEHPAG